jgi:hypothetical protein
MLSGKDIWSEIKNKEMNVFAMAVKVSDYCEYVDIDPSKCFLVCKASAALPALETALGDNYSCTLVEKYVLVEKKNAI